MASDLSSVVHFINLRYLLPPPEEIVMRRTPGAVFVLVVSKFILGVWEI